MPHATATEELCGAKIKRGGTCTRSAGWGTSHPGYGTCKYHGGATPNANKSAAVKIARSMGEPLDIEPHEALIACVQITAGEVAYCTLRIQQLSTEEYTGRPETHVDKDLALKTDSEGNALYDHLEQTTEHPVELNLWITARAACMDRLARYSKMALDAGVEERRVRLAESMAMQLAPVLQAIFKELGLTDKQRDKAPAIVERHLVALEATSAFAINGNGDSDD